MLQDGRQANPTDAAVDDTDEATVVDTPSEEKKPEPSTETLTKEQAEKLANERHSKLDKRISELERETQQHARVAEAAEARAKAAEARSAEAQARADEAERKSLGDTPDALTLFEAKVAHRREMERLAHDKEAFEAEKRSHAEEIAEAKSYRTARVADEIAKEYGVDATLLTEMTDGSREKMEKLAKVLPKKEDGTPNLQKPPKPDSGKRSAGAGTKTVEQLDKMSNDDYFNMREAEEREKKR